MLNVIKMAGTSQELYKCVAPLVMNPEVIKYNHNYPFKTSESFVWFVAFVQKKVVGFFPLEIRKKSVVINNYYVAGDEEEIFMGLLGAVINDLWDVDKTLEAVVQKGHEPYFFAQGFEVERMWSTYLKLRRKNEKG